jgi:hypothetical protein
MVRLATPSLFSATSAQNTSSESSDKKISQVSKTSKVDYFENSKALVGSDLTNIEAISTFWTHFLLDQQKSANLQIASSNELLNSTFESEEITKFLTVYPELKSDLEAFEKLKKWDSEDRTVNLENNEAYMMSLLKLLLNREDVHLIQWLDVGFHDYENFKIKQQAIEKNNKKNQEALEQELAQLAALQNQLKKTHIEEEKSSLKNKIARLDEEISIKRNLIKIDAIHLDIIKEKMKIFNYVFTNKSNQIPLENIKDIVRTRIAPAIHQAKSWITFGKRCLQLATDLNNAANRFQNTQLLQKRSQLEANILEIIEAIKQEISKNNALLSMPEPKLKDI